MLNPVSPSSTYDIFNYMGVFIGSNPNESEALEIARHVGGKAILVQIVSDVDEEFYEEPYGCPHCGSYEGDSTECPECGHGQ